MDEKTLAEGLLEEMVNGWEVIPTGGGYMIRTDWQLPNRDRIEIYIRMVGDREDLFLVTDGGELFNLLYSQGIDLTKDEHGMRVFQGVADNYGAQVVEYQLAKGANEGDLHHAIRLVLEAVKDAAYLLWHKLEPGVSIH